MKLIIHSLVPGDGDTAEIVKVIDHQRIDRLELEAVRMGGHYHRDDPHSVGDALYRSILADDHQLVIGHLVSEESDWLLSTARALDRSFTHAGLVIEKPVVFLENSDPAQLSFSLGAAVAHCIEGVLPGIFIAKNGIHPIAPCEQVGSILTTV